MATRARRTRWIAVLTLIVLPGLAACSGGKTVTAAGEDTTTTTPPPPPPPPPPTASGCATPQAGWLFCDDFDQNRIASYFEYDSAGGSFVRASGVGRGATFGMRAHFNAGQVSAGSLKLAFGRTPGTYFRPVDAGTNNYRELFWRFYLRNDVNWIGGGGNKLTRATSFVRSDWSQAMIGHLWSAASPNENYLLLDPASGTDEAGVVTTSGYNDFAHLRWLGQGLGRTPIFDDTHRGQWYCIETHVRLNDAGQSNGILEFWVNGNLESQRAGLNWVGSYSTYGLNAVFLENFWNVGAPQAETRYFDDFVVSTRRIGC